MGSFWETSPFMGKHPQHREKEQMQVKGINQTQNLREFQWKAFTTPNKIEYPSCKQTVQTVGERTSNNFRSN